MRGCRGAVSTGRLHEPDSMCGCALNLQLRGLKTLPLRMAYNVASQHKQVHPPIANPFIRSIPAAPLGKKQTT